MSYARVNLHDVDDVEMSQMEGAAQAPHGVLPQPLPQQPHLQLLHAAAPAGPHDERAPIFAGERVDEEADIVAFRTRLVSRRVNMTAVRYMTDAWGMVKRNIPFFFLLGLGYLVLVLLPFAPAVFFWFKMMMQEFGMHGRHASDGGSDGSGGNGADDSRGGSGSWPSMSSLAFEAPNELPAPHDGYAFDFIAWALIGLVLEVFVSAFILLPMRASLTRAIFDSMRSDGVLRVRTALCWAYACPFCGRLLMLTTVICVPQMVLSSIFFPAALIWLMLTMLAVPMFIDNEERLTVFECVTNSVSVMSRHIFGSLRWVLMSVVVAFLGALCFGVGLFLAVPVIFISQMFMYHHLVGVRGCVLEPSLVEVAAPPRAAPVAAAPASAGNVMAVVPASAQGYAMAPMTHAAPVMYPLAPSGAYAQAAAFHPAPPMAHPSMYAQAYPGMMAAAPPPSYLPAHDLHAHAAMYPGAMVYAVPMASDPHASASAPPPVNPYAV